jgi:hypothetical protein
MRAALERWQALWAAEARAPPFARNQKSLEQVEAALAAGG